MPGKDYKALYRFQNQFLHWLATQHVPFYLTGGTALSRFYVHHRYSDDLDFFANAYSDFLPVVQQIIRKMPPIFAVDKDALMLTKDFCRLFIVSEGTMLKIEFVNDVAARVGVPHQTTFGLIDTPANILANKITALMGRDEPKDVFDIVTLAKNYRFNWQDAMHWAKQKAAINELEVEARLSTFPLAFLQDVAWLKEAINIKSFEDKRLQVCNDILTGNNNTLGENAIALEQAPIVL